MYGDLTRPMNRAGGEGRSDLARLDIIVALHRDETSEMLFRELQRTRACVRHIWPLPDQLPEAADVIFCDAMPSVMRLIPWIPGDPKAALVAVVSPTSDIDFVRKCAPDAVLHRPFTGQAVLLSLIMAHAQFTYGSRLRQKIAKLDETMRTIRNVERAKAILMANRALREEDAYQFIRTQAMSRRVSIGTLASAIVDSGDLLG